MIKLRIESAHSAQVTSTGWFQNEAAGHAAAIVHPTLAADSSVALAFRAEPDFLDEEVMNFVALFGKCWKHLSFMAAFPAGARTVVPLNPWKVLKELLNSDEFTDAGQVLARALQDSPLVTFGSDRVVTVRIFRGRHPASAIRAVAWRLANAAEWAVRYSPTARLTTTTPLKWDTFNAITLRGERGLPAPAEGAVDDDGQPVVRQTLEQLVAGVQERRAAREAARQAAEIAAAAEAARVRQVRAERAAAARREEAAEAAARAAAEAAAQPPAQASDFRVTGTQTGRFVERSDAQNPEPLGGWRGDPERPARARSGDEVQGAAVAPGGEEE